MKDEVDIGVVVFRDGWGIDWQEREVKNGKRRWELTAYGPSGNWVLYTTHARLPSN